MFYNIKCLFHTFVYEEKHILSKRKRGSSLVQSEPQGVKWSFELNFCRGFSVLMCQNVFRGFEPAIWNTFCRLGRRIYIQNLNC